MKSTFIFLLLSVLPACGAAPETSQSAAVADTQSIDQRADGRFDVVCRDGRHQIVTATELQQNNVCLQGGGGGGTITLADRSYSLYLPEDPTIEIFGKGLWDGWLNFHLEISDDQSIQLTDGAGTQFVVNGGSRDFNRLKLPVTLKANNRYHGGSAKMTGITAEVTHVNDLPSQGVTYRFAMTSSSPATLLKTFGEDLRGVRLTFYATAQFFNNFDAGTTCGQLELRGADRTIILTDATPSQQVQLLAPLAIYSNVRCTSSRKATPEDATNDFKLNVSSFTLGNPV